MLICGLDECGRGPLAGPIVAAAVILTGPVQGLKDSKLLKEEKRKKIYQLIIESGAIVRVEMISVRLINNRGIGWANKEVFRKLIKQIEADEYIVDGNLKLGRVWGKSERIKSVVDADETIVEVMAASIVAKEIRDNLMRELHELHPEYGWITNVGYGTRHHIMALEEYGSTKHHRKLFVDTALKKGLARYGQTAELARV